MWNEITPQEPAADVQFAHTQTTLPLKLLEQICKTTLHAKYPHLAPHARQWHPHIGLPSSSQSNLDKHNFLLITLIFSAARDTSSFELFIMVLGCLRQLCRSVLTNAIHYHHRNCFYHLVFPWNGCRWAFCTQRGSAGSFPGQQKDRSCGRLGSEPSRGSSSFLTQCFGWGLRCHNFTSLLN
jgi:hypothetical protein